MKDILLCRGLFWVQVNVKNIEVDCNVERLLQIACLDKSTIHCIGNTLSYSCCIVEVERLVVDFNIKVVGKQAKVYCTVRWHMA